MSDNKETFRKEFSSWGAFVDYCENAPSEITIDHRASRRDDASYKYFTHAENWKEVLDLSKEGWPEGLKKSKEIASSLFDHVSSMIERVDVNHDIEGHAIDVARYVDGEPECWLKFENVIQESENGHKLIKITFNCSVSAGVSIDTIIARGATIVALIELLEYAGHRVELTLAHAVSDYRHETVPTMSAFVKIKEFDQNLNMPMISYALAHPSVLRALMFSYMETAPYLIRRLVGVPDGGYGTPRDIQTEDKGDIHISHGYGGYGGDIQWRDQKSAEKWILEQLQKQGVHLKKEK